MTVRLFAYGTLRSDLDPIMVPAQAGAARQMLRAGGAREGFGWVRGRLFAVSWYPGLTDPESPEDRVRGEVWRLRDRMLLSRLDRYEGGEYRRCIRRVRLDSGRLQMAHVYLYLPNPGMAPRIPSGDFAEWLANPGRT